MKSANKKTNPFGFQILPFRDSVHITFWCVLCVSWSKLQNKPNLNIFLMFLDAAGGVDELFIAPPGIKDYNIRLI